MQEVTMDNIKKEEKAKFPFKEIIILLGIISAIVVVLALLNRLPFWSAIIAGIFIVLAASKFNQL